MTAAKGSFRLWLLLGTTTLISGLTPVAAGLATEELPPLTLALVRFGVAGVLLRLTANALRIPLRFQPGDRWLLLLLAAICVPVNQAAFLFGVRLASASHAGIAYALVPVLVFWLTLVMGTARLTARLAIATVLAFVGAAAASYTGPDVGGGDMSAVSGVATRVLLGDGLLFAAAVSWSLFIVWSQDLVKRAGAVQTLAAVFLIGAALQVPLAVADVLFFDAARFEWGSVSWRGLGGFAFITLITAYTNFLLFYLVLARYDVTRASIVTNASFLIAVLVDAAITQRPLSLWVAVGSVLLFIGIGLTRHDEDAAGP